MYIKVTKLHEMSHFIAHPFQSYEKTILTDKLQKQDSKKVPII